MPTSSASPRTEFSRDILGRYICNGLEEARASANRDARADARPFDVIVVGGGTFGPVFAQHLFAADKAHTHRILVLEAGPFALPEHVQNLPMLGLNPPGPTSLADLRRNGQDRAPRNEVWGLPWHSDTAHGFPGLAYCLGGRSLFWGGWSPQPLDTEMADWPPAVRQQLDQSYFADAARQIGVSEVNDFIHGPLHEALRKQLFEAVNAGLVTDAVALAELPLHLDLSTRAVAVMGAAAGVARAPQPVAGRAGSVSGIDIWKLEAPLAVQSRTERAGFFPTNKFSSMQLLIKASRAAFYESSGDDVKKRLMVVPNCHVTRLVPGFTPSGGLHVRQIETNQGLLDVPVNGVLVLALGTIESTRLALQLLDSIPSELRPSSPIGRNLMAHLRSNLDIRISRSALKELDPQIKDLQTSALFVKGRHEFMDGTFGHYHLQITASGLGPRGAGSEAELFQKVPDLDTLDSLQAADDSHVVVTIRGIGEMQPQNPASWVALDGETDEFSARRAFVRVVPSAKDEELWNVMDQAAADVAEIFAGDQPYQVLKTGRDGLGTTHHEAGTLWMGTEPDSSVTDTNARLHALDNVYVAGPALFPRSGSPNPMLGGVALARRLADHLAPNVPFQPEPGFRALFDGLSTANWRMSTIRNQPGRDNPGQFLLVDGALEAVPGNDLGLFWCTTPAPGDYLLKLEWLRWGQNDNSGVFLRFPDPESQGYDNTAYVPVNLGFEVQIDELGVPDGAPIHKTGAIYGQPGQTLTQTPARPPGQWNEFEIIVQAQTYTVFLNGQLVTRFENTDLSRGRPSSPGALSFIGLQAHTGRVAFRRIRIKPL